MIPLIAVVGFVVGVGVFDARTTDEVLKQLSADEKVYLVLVQPQIEMNCPDQDSVCRDGVAQAIRDVINFRRGVYTRFGFEVFDKLRAQCEANPSVFSQRDCFSSRLALSYRKAMQLAGIPSAGVTMRGYWKLRTRMSLSEVEYILGGPGEQISYVGYGGHSNEAIQWRSGHGMIVLTFIDSELAGKSQSGLSP